MMADSSPSPVATAAESAVRAVLDSGYAAWAENDTDAFMAIFTRDATSILPGAYRDSTEMIRDRMEAGFLGPLKGTQVIYEVQSLRLLGDDAAVVVSRDGVLMAGETHAPTERWVMATWVLTKQEGKWLVAAYHNCPA